MTAPASRPPSATYRAGVRTIRQAPDSFIVVTVPPIHAARVYRRGKEAHWTVEYYTFDQPRKYPHESVEKALNAAGELIGLRAGKEWKERFTGAQRTAIGQQRCPRIMGRTTCDQPAEGISIWCTWHPKGKDRE